MKVVVLGSGGREHALAWKLEQSPLVETVFALPGNGGLSNCVAMDPSDFTQLKSFCEQEKITHIIVGPEDLLAKGIVDFFETSAIQVFGASQKAAQLESSKIFAKNFMKKYGVTTPDFEVFQTRASAQKTIREKKGNLVIKYDGLASGKGVWVCRSESEAQAALMELEQQFGIGSSFLIADRLEGQEGSLIGFIDEKTIKILPPTEDYKPLLEGNKGANTGGMGAVCPAPFWTSELENLFMENILQPTLRGIQAEEMNYKGILYFGLIIHDNKPYVLEYNVRMGDPEAEVLLPKLETDLMELICTCFDQQLATTQLVFNTNTYVSVTIASKGYPKSYPKGLEIKGLGGDKKVLVFHAGTRLEEGSYYTNGGRVLHIVGMGKDRTTARQVAYQGCRQIDFEGVIYRKDIGEES
jgi:phosphoribosylamine--glycine ligase